MTKSLVQQLRNYAMFILMTAGRWSNYPFGRMAMDIVQPPILHYLLFCPHELRVCLVNNTFHQPTMRFGLGRTKISTYLPKLTNKEIGTTFSALQPSPPWLQYSTSIIWPVTRQLLILRQVLAVSVSHSVCIPY